MSDMSDRLENLRAAASVCLANLIELSEETTMVYLHDHDGKPRAMVIPVDGWWASHLPAADKAHFSHDHIELGEPETIDALLS